MCLETRIAHVLRVSALPSELMVLALIVDPLGADDGEFGATDFGGELCVGEWRGVRLAADALLEVFEVFEVEDLAAAHEVEDLAGGAVDGVHADEVGFFVDADGVEAVVDVGLHEVEGVVGVAKGPAFVVGEDGGDVVELGGGDVGTWRGLWRSSEKKGESGGQEHAGG